MPYIPAPRTLQAFPEAQRTKPKTSVKGGSGLRQRWKDQDGEIYEWDSRHGTVEKYDRQGRHLGEFDSETGDLLKPANPNYSVEP
jgi:Cytotoxic